MKHDEQISRLRAALLQFKLGLTLLEPILKSFETDEMADGIMFAPDVETSMGNIEESIEMFKHMIDWLKVEEENVAKWAKEDASGSDNVREDVTETLELCSRDCGITPERVCEIFCGDEHGSGVDERPRLERY